MIVHMLESRVGLTLMTLLYIPYYAHILHIAPAVDVWVRLIAQIPGRPLHKGIIPITIIFPLSSVCTERKTTVSRDSAFHPLRNHNFSTKILLKSTFHRFDASLSLLSRL